MTKTDEKRVGRIYQMVNMMTNEKYVGASFQPLHKRLYVRKSQYERWLQGKLETDRKLFKNIHEYGFECFRMELLEEVKVRNKQELFKIEGDWIRKLDTFKNGLNSQISGLTEEGKKQHKKKWRDNNKEQINLNQKQKMECECNCIITKRMLKRHLKTKKHKTLMNKKSQHRNE